MTKKESDDMMFPSSKHPAMVYDPNPRDPAEYCLTLAASINTAVEFVSNSAQFSERMHDLYGGLCPQIIIDRCIADLRDRGSTVIYTGTLKQCIAFSGTFKEMGFGAQYTEIKL